MVVQVFRQIEFLFRNCGSIRLQKGAWIQQFAIQTIEISLPNALLNLPNQVICPIPGNVQYLPWYSTVHEDFSPVR